VLAGGQDKAAMVLRLLGNPAPSASFTAVPPTADAGSRVSFDARSSKDLFDPITFYRWDFGDHASGTGARIAHTYTRPGTYVVRLAIADSDQALGFAQHTIDSSGPTADHTARAIPQALAHGKCTRLDFPQASPPTDRHGLQLSPQRARADHAGLPRCQGPPSRARDPRVQRSHRPRSHQLAGRLNREHRLAPGSYTATLTAKANGRRSRATRLKFTIVG
jgi:hypothetical protein